MSDDDDTGILDEIESELSDLSPDDDSDPYDPTEEFENTGDHPETVSVEWPDVDPTTRDLSAEEWGIHGEGPPELWNEFTEMLNDGRLGDLPSEIRPDPPSGWGESDMPKARSAQKPRGKHLFAHIGATPATMLRVEGEVGHKTSGTPREEFIGELEPKVNDYAERFEAGDRPGRFFAFVKPDRGLWGPQEGRHRAAAAMLAGIEWVPVVVLFKTDGTFRRPKSYNDVVEGEDYLKKYPEGEA